LKAEMKKQQTAVHDNKMSVINETEEAWNESPEKNPSGISEE